MKTLSKWWFKNDIEILRSCSLLATSIWLNYLSSHITPVFSGERAYYTFINILILGCLWFGNTIQRKL